MRNRFFFALDLLLLAPLPFIAVGLRFESTYWSPELLHAARVYAALVLPLRLIVANATGLYRCIWRHASMAEVERILFASSIAGVGSVLVGTVVLVHITSIGIRLPYSALVLDALLALCVLAAPRLLVRYRGARNAKSHDRRRAIVVGAGAAGQLILRETRLNPNLKLNVVAFVDDDQLKQKQLLGSVPICGTLADLPSLIGPMGVDEIIIAMPHARGSVIRKVVHAASEAGVHARTIPGFERSHIGQITVSALRPVEIQDLLRRDAIVTDLEAVRALATGRIVFGHWRWRFNWRRAVPTNCRARTTETHSPGSQREPGVRDRR